MLIPRFSLRQLLVVTTASALFCYVIAMGTRGHQWAIALSLAVASLLLALVVHALVFSVAWFIASLGSLFTRRRVASSPFASAAPPPQFITPPEDTE